MTSGFNFAMFKSNYFFQYISWQMRPGFPTVVFPTVIRPVSAGFTNITQSYGASCARMNLRQLPKSRPHRRILLSLEPVAMTVASDDMSRHVIGRL